MIAWRSGLETGERPGSGRGSGWHAVETCAGLVGVLHCVFLDANVRGGVWCCRSWWRDALGSFYRSVLDEWSDGVGKGSDKSERTG